MPNPLQTRFLPSPGPVLICSPNPRSGFSPTDRRRADPERTSGLRTDVARRGESARKNPEGALGEPEMLLGSNALRRIGKDSTQLLGHVTIRRKGTFEHRECRGARPKPV